MGGAEAAVRNQFMDKYFKDTAFTIGTTYVSLHTADPSDGTEDEVTGGSYARQSVAEADWNAASSGLTDNKNNIDFTGMPSTTVTHVGLYEDSTAGSLKWSGALDNSRSTDSGDTLRFESGDLNFQIT